MMDTLVSVTIQKDPISVLVDTETPQVTITDNSNMVTVIEASPVYVATADNTDTVIINYGGYGGSVGLAALLSDLVGHLTIDQMSPDLASDLTRLESLWNRVGNELILSYPDGVAIQEAGRAYTDSSITDIVADINISVDGKIDAAYSYIEQTASSIDQRIVSMEGDVDDRFIVAESRILQTESSITSTVSRLDTIDGPGGSVELLQSSIDQQADSITLEVAARQLVEGNLLIAQSNIALLTDSITLMTTSIDTLNNQMTETSIILGTNGINLTVLQESLGQQQYTLSTVQSMLTNQWGVTIAEDAGGNAYATGFGLILHPIWLYGESYSVNYIVSYEDKIYKCLIAHISDYINHPLGDNGGTYWDELEYGVKSSFVVSADSFVIRTPTGSDVSLLQDLETSPKINSAFVGSMAYENKVELAKLGSTIIQGGYLKTNLIQTSAIVISDLSGAGALAGQNTVTWSTQVTGTGKPANYADVTANNTSYDTARVAGTSATTIRDKANNAFPSASAGALAYLSKVNDGHITSISGGKISTGVIYGNSNYSYWDLNNNKMYFTGTSNIEFASTAYLKFGSLASIKGPGSETISFTSGQITLNSGAGSYLWLWNTYAKLVTDEDLFLEAANDVFITAGSAYKTYFKFGSTNKIHINQYGMRPVTSNNMLLGDSGYYWASCYATTFYDNGGGYQDLQDDLTVMAEFKPRKNIIIDPETKEKTIPQHTEINPDTGLEYLDLLSIPRWMTNYDSVVKKLKSENGDLLSNEDIEELLEDYHEAGWLLCRNISAFNDCTSGGVRQLDIEMKELYELMANRITVLENKIKNKEAI